MTNKVKSQISGVDQKVWRVPGTDRAGGGREGLSKRKGCEFGVSGMSII